MVTKEDLARGVRFVASEAQRAASFFDEAQWGRRTADGWTVKEVYCHLLATAQGMNMFLPALRNLPDGADLGALFDIDDINAKGVAANIDKAPAELVDGIAQAYEALVPVIEGLDPALMEKRITFGVYKMPVADLAATAIVLHGLAHVYHCVAAGEPHI